MLHSLTGKSQYKKLKLQKHYTLIFRRSRAGNSVVNGLIWFEFELIQPFMHVHVSCKNEEVPIKNALEWPQLFSHFKYKGIFQMLNGS